MSSDNKSPLFVSCKNREPKIFKYLIDKGSNINDESNKKLLLEVCDKENHFKFIDYLLSKGMNPEITNDDIFIKLIYDESLLYIASKYQNIEVIELLIAKGLDVNAENISFLMKHSFL